MMITSILCKLVVVLSYFSLAVYFSFDKMKLRLICESVMASTLLVRSHYFLPTHFVHNAHIVGRNNHIPINIEELRSIWILVCVFTFPEMSHFVKCTFIEHQLFTTNQYCETGTRPFQWWQRWHCWLVDGNLLGNAIMQLKVKRLLENEIPWHGIPFFSFKFTTPLFCQKILLEWNFSTTHNPHSTSVWKQIKTKFSFGFLHLLNRSLVFW